MPKPRAPSGDGSSAWNNLSHTLPPVHTLPLSLFHADRFSCSMPEFSAAANCDAEAVRAILAQYYSHLGLRHATIKRCGGLNVNSKNFLAESQAEKVIVKRIPTRDPAAVESKLRLADWLRNEGLPLPGVQRTGDGTLLACQEECVWCVLDFVEGQFFHGGQPELAEAAASVNSMCAALERTPDCFRIVDTIDPPQEKYRVDLEEIHRNRANWDSLYTPAYGAILSNNWTTISETLDAVLAELGSTG